MKMLDLVKSTGCNYKFAFKNGDGYVTVWCNKADSTVVVELIQNAAEEIGADIVQIYQFNFNPAYTTVYAYIRGFGDETSNGLKR